VEGDMAECLYTQKNNKHEDRSEGGRTRRGNVATCSGRLCIVGPRFPISKSTPVSTVKGRIVKQRKGIVG